MTPEQIEILNNFLRSNWYPNLVILGIAKVFYTFIISDFFGKFAAKVMRFGETVIWLSLLSLIILYG